MKKDVERFVYNLRLSAEVQVVEMVNINWPLIYCYRVADYLFSSNRLIDLLSKLGATCERQRTISNHV